MRSRVASPKPLKNRALALTAISGLSNITGMPYILAVFRDDRRNDPATTPPTEISMSKPMTIGQLARRSGVSIRALRELDAMKLVYGLGRSGSNYRLFDESALWCLQMIGSLRSLGLTLKEIQEICAVYIRQPGEPIGPHLQQKLDGVLDRTEARIAEIQEVRHRIHRFRLAHAGSLVGQADLELYASDPRRRLLRVAS
jgi:MerR family transcriptional regulator, copper efflux regulator